MDLKSTVFHRKFSASYYKSLRLSLADMTFCHDFIGRERGDLYPLLEKDASCCETVESNTYAVTGGTARRFFCQLFPYATYEVCGGGTSYGFVFALPHASASVLRVGGEVHFSCGTESAAAALPADAEAALTVSLRPGAFDVYCRVGGALRFVVTFSASAFAESHRQTVFTSSYVSLSLCDGAVTSVSSFIDSGVGIADIRPICYEDGSVIVEDGAVFLTASIRMEEGCFQGIFSWIPGTAVLSLTGALFYDSGDGLWCGDVAASLRYHRSERRWLLWVCAFSHGHILGHAAFDGDVRRGVNVVDITLMQAAEPGDDWTAFLGRRGDEDPDFFYDAAEQRWYLALCRLDPAEKSYRYVFYSSDQPFSGYRLRGVGYPGAETGGSFVRIGGKTHFVCGNRFDLTSNYRIYDENGMAEAQFDFPDGGFRGWGTVIVVAQGSRTRYYWLTFDRRLGSAYNWSYGNFYCFEAYDI